VATDCNEINYSAFNEPMRSTYGQVVTMQDIIGSHNEMYMLMILLSSIILLMYVLYTNFILNTRFDVLTRYKIDVHELSILPTIALFIISLSFFGVI